jgi:AraC-like DNA-binding protein
METSVKLTEVILLRLQRFTPFPELVPYIQSIWLFESKSGIPSDDLRLIVPNGGIKLIIPFRNRVYSQIGESKKDYPEMTCWIVGQMDKPAFIDSDPDICTLGIEFKAMTAYKFFPFGMRELTNSTFPATDIWGAAGTELREQLGHTDRTEDKVAFVQSFLLRQLDRSVRNSAFVEFAVRHILNNEGQVRIEELCREAGYTKRHLGRMFAELVGVSPKQFAGIVRFHRIYRMIGNTDRSYTKFTDFYDVYYDQSNFIKEFQRYTSLTPHDYQKRDNSFGSIFLK